MKAFSTAALALGVMSLGTGILPGAAAPAAAQYTQIIPNDMRKCAPGGGPAVRLTIRGIKSATGNIRLQTYRATKADWLEKDKWINRIEVPARRGSMTFCVPLPAAGDYAIAVRHDANNNDDTDIMQDGGAMSNNPAITIFNLARPSVEQTRFRVGKGVERMTITMLYFG
jgi:uncharacterized protein (DUF2141 family)